MKRLLFLLTCLTFNLYTMAQSAMDNGFKMLETGAYADAEHFFDRFLDANPQNRTAQICYGRAVGLNGRPQEANQLFGNLIAENPKDYEVRINYYESFLWSKEYQKAEPLYASLVRDHPNQFGALLGYANTLSNLQKYEEALVWVDKALQLEPNNENAAISKKYIKLGLANQLSNAQQYDRAILELQNILAQRPTDRETLLNLANIYLITKKTDSAQWAYAKMAINHQDSIVARNGMALAAHIAGNEKGALEMSTKTLGVLQPNEETTLRGQTYERYVQALIWNRKFTKAKTALDTLGQQFGKTNWIHALKATLGMYTGNFKMSLQQYDSILAQDQNSFDGNLGKANALFALGRIHEAYEATFTTLDIFKNQKDAQGLLEKMNGLYSPTVEEGMAYSFDNGNNMAYSASTGFQFPFSSKILVKGRYGYRGTENSLSGSRAETHTFVAGIQYALFPKTKIEGNFGVNRANFDRTGYSQPLLQLKLATEPLRLQNLEMGYQREIQNFNSELISREIVQNHFGASYHLGSNIGFGWYTQLMHTTQSDGNKRNLLFTSLYYMLTRKPLLKMGANFQYLGFAEQLPSIYFSPEQYMAGEVFAELSGTFSDSFTYRIQAATGLQRVEQENSTSIFRAESRLAYQLSKRLGGGLYGKYSTISSDTAAGFQFTEMGLHLKWSLSKQPVFYNKLASR